MLLENLIVFNVLILTILILADEPLLVHVVWRHGDRSPLGTFKNDPYNESSWPQKYGELSLKGMERVVRLGRQFRQLYIKNLKLLSEEYRSDEIYVRSTDSNRTIISAMSTLIGIYYNNVTEAGTNYPNGIWPAHFIPIAVHTVDPMTDHMLNPALFCKRQQWLWTNVMKTPEFLKLKAESEEILTNLSKATGVENLTLETLWFVYDIIYNEFLDGRNTVIDKRFFLKVEYVKKLVDDMADGLYISNYDGIPLRSEIAKIRGGGLLWNMINHIDQKIHCINASNREKPECKWMSNLKFYSYSAHDTTLSALLAVLNAKEKVVSLGPAFYGAALTFELWKLTNGSLAIKMRFQQEDDVILDARTINGTNGLIDVTDAIEGCENAIGFCLYDVIRERAVSFYAGDYSILCEDTSSKQVDMWPTVTPTVSKNGAERLQNRFIMFNSVFAITVDEFWTKMIF